MKVAAEMRGKAAVMKKLDSVDAESKRMIKFGIKLGLIKIHEAAVKGMQGTSRGKKVRRYNPRRNVWASKPGDPPNIDTGSFASSIQWRHNKAWWGTVGTNDKRGPAFEFGTKRMKKRPWLKPAVKKVKKELGDQFKFNVKRVK